MSKSILIRELSKEDSRKLDELKELFFEKTNSKMVLKLIRNYKRLFDSLDDTRQELSKERRKVQLLEAFRSNIEYEIDLLESCYSQNDNNN